ncbi:DNA polymerase III subunit beta [Clostridium baratii]
MKALIKTKYIKEIRKLLKGEYIDIYVDSDGGVDITTSKDNVTILVNLICEETEQGDKSILSGLLDCIDDEEFMIHDKLIVAGRTKIHDLYDAKHEKKIELKLDNHVLRISNEELQKGLECVYCVAKTDDRKILKNIYVNENEFVALDGYRMAIRRVNAEAKNEFYIHQNLAKVLTKLKKYTGDVEFFLDGDRTIVYIDGLYIISKKEAEKDIRFVNYRSLIPKDQNKFVKFNKYELKELKDTLRRNIKFGMNANNPLKLRFEKSKSNDIDILKLNFGNELEKTLSCTVKNIEDEFKIGINPRYLLEGLKNYNDSITMKFNSEVSPIIIEDDNKTELMLPIKIIRK